MTYLLQYVNIKFFILYLSSNFQIWLLNFRFSKKEKKNLSFSWSNFHNIESIAKCFKTATLNFEFSPFKYIHNIKRKDGVPYQWVKSDYTYGIHNTLCCIIYVTTLSNIMFYLQQNKYRHVWLVDNRCN